MLSHRNPILPVSISKCQNFSIQLVSPDGAIQREEFSKLLTHYYEIHGYDVETGVPTLETAKKLGVEKELSTVLSSSALKFLFFLNPKKSMHRGMGHRFFLLRRIRTAS